MRAQGLIVRGAKRRKAGKKSGNPHARNVARQWLSPALRLWLRFN